MTGFPGFRVCLPPPARNSSSAFFLTRELIFIRKPGNPVRIDRLPGPPGGVCIAGLMAAIPVQFQTPKFGSGPTPLNSVGS
jgi:hypothetical protein